MLLKDGSEFHIDIHALNTLRDAYPGIDIEGEVRKMEAWCLCNPAKRKSRRGALRFVNSWLSRAPQSTSTRHTTLAEDLSDTSWAT